jgi:hypothetical protein
MSSFTEYSVVLFSDTSNTNSILVNRLTPFLQSFNCHAEARLVLLTSSPMVFSQSFLLGRPFQFEDALRFAYYGGRPIKGPTL